MTKKKITEKIIAHCGNIGLAPNSKGYLINTTDNLIELFNNWEQTEKEINQGQGSELKTDRYGVIKFNAVHSSSALCVNNFSPFKRDIETFKFIGLTNFKEARFEKKLHTGISKPNLDFYLETENEIIGIESKFTEHVEQKLPNKENNLLKYQDRPQLNYLPDGFKDLIQEYILSEKKCFLDVAQLIKHSIGLINHARQEKNKKPILVYIYWHPENWEEMSVFQEHQQEIKEFSIKIGQYLRFESMSYQDFWLAYENDLNFGEHIKKIKERYSMTI